MTDQSPQQLREEIEQTREQLGETVEQLAAKADVKARATEAVHQRKQETVETVKRNPAIPAGAAAAVLLAALVIIRRRR
jgi:hypothetical protein